MVMGFYWVLCGFMVCFIVFYNPTPSNLPSIPNSPSFCRPFSLRRFIGPVILPLPRQGVCVLSHLG